MMSNGVRRMCVIIFSSKQCMRKQIIGFGFCDIWNKLEVSVSVISQSRTLTSTLIILDITKTESGSKGSVYNY